MKEWPFKYKHGEYNLYVLYHLFRLSNKDLDEETKRYYINTFFDGQETEGITEEDIRRDYLNKYWRGTIHRGTPSLPQFEHISTIKILEMDESSQMYDEQFNPVEFWIRTEYEYTTVLKRKRGNKTKKQHQVIFNPDGTQLYSFTCHIMSVDDGSYTAWYKGRTKKECLSLRTKLYKWFIDNPVVNGHEFEMYCRSLDSNVEWSMN